MKSVLLLSMVASSLIGMDNDIHTKKYHRKWAYYAENMAPIEHKSVFLHRVAYPVFIKKSVDNKIEAQFNFDRPVVLINWHAQGKYVLYVTLDNHKVHRFDLKHLERIY